MKAKKISKEEYLEYVYCLKESFDIFLDQQAISPSQATRIAEEVEAKAAAAKEQGKVYNKWKDPTEKLCQDWWFTTDIIDQIETGRLYYSKGENAGKWVSDGHRIRLHNMVEKNRHIKRLWEGHNTHGKIFYSDIV